MIVEKPGRIGKLKELDTLQVNKYPVHARVKVGTGGSFKIVVYVDDMCEPCTKVLEAVLDVESVNKHVTFELVNVSHVEPYHKIFTTPTIIVADDNYRVISRASGIPTNTEITVRMLEEMLMSGYIYTHPYIDKLLAELIEASKNCSVCFNNQQTVMKLLTAVLVNYDEFGMALCPCKRPAWIKLPREERADYVCPCLEFRSTCNCSCRLLIPNSERANSPMRSLLEYLDILIQVLIRHHGLVNTLVHDSLDEVRYTITRSPLATLVELSMATSEVVTAVTSSYKKQKRLNTS